ncbi:TetR/AcrR family transcriptional regulator [uncultured Maribacter sp.]|uniref:TetR/AcrR family transcriptional regulator n=1 Tax=uncultured Maribacter sp. TaxID=431308 RepID=UPI0026367106|nr:TetR/AcrR family transcriptional regulator [uncultured Maribacter sp.]
MKQKIKIQALVLFNTTGISNVSMKQIADSLQISAGNLQYHYKNKGVLLRCIYGDMYQEALHYIIPKDSYITLHHFEDIILKFDALQNKYSFFFNEIIHIGRNYPDILKRHAHATLERLKEGKVLLDYYVETERLKPETELVDYDKLVHTFWMLSTFWQSQRQIIMSTAYVVNQCHVVEILWNILLPHLTEKGIAEYKQIRKYIPISK